MSWKHGTVSPYDPSFPRNSNSNLNARVVRAHWIRSEWAERAGSFKFEFLEKGDSPEQTLRIPNKLFPDESHSAFQHFAVLRTATRIDQKYFTALAGNNFRTVASGSRYFESAKRGFISEEVLTGVPGTLNEHLFSSWSHTSRAFPARAWN